MEQASVTIADVARLAGVSKVTVSKTLNNSGRISQETRERVLKAAKDLGYTVNYAARSLRGGRTNLLGMVVPELISPYFTDVARAAAEAASRVGLDLGVFTTSRDQKREQERIGILQSGLADGLLIVVPSDSASFLASLEKSKIPVVLINHFGAKTHLPTVCADNYHGARAAVEHLLALGHERIGFVTGAKESTQAQERLRAFKDTLGARGLMDETLIAEGNFTQRRGFEAGQELLNHAQPPTAIFAASDATAFGVIDAIKDRGLRIPDDLSVVGFDDVLAASQIHPTLTTVSHPIEDMNATAVRLICEMLDGESHKDTLIDFPSSLVVRESTGPRKA